MTSRPPEDAHQMSILDEFPELSPPQHFPPLALVVCCCNSSLFSRIFSPISYCYWLLLLLLKYYVSTKSLFCLLLPTTYLHHHCLLPLYHKLLGVAVPHSGWLARSSSSTTMAMLKFCWWLVMRSKSPAGIYLSLLFCCPPPSSVDIGFFRCSFVLRLSSLSTWAWALSPTIIY